MHLLVGFATFVGGSYYSWCASAGIYMSSGGRFLSFFSLFFFKKKEYPTSTPPEHEGLAQTRAPHRR